LLHFLHWFVLDTSAVYVRSETGKIHRSTCLRYVDENADPVQSLPEDAEFADCCSERETRTRSKGDPPQEI